MAKGKRLSDTAALVAGPASGSVEHSISTRKIDNGYIVRTSSYNNETGECRSSETFSPRAPNIDPPRVRGNGNDASSSLSKAIQSLKGD